jgi:hypothetical protein
MSADGVDEGTGEGTSAPASQGLKGLQATAAKLVQLDLTASMPNIARELDRIRDAAPDPAKSKLIDAATRAVERPAKVPTVDLGAYQRSVRDLEQAREYARHRETIEAIKSSGRPSTRRDVGLVVLGAVLGGVIGVIATIIAGLILRTI